MRRTVRALFLMGLLLTAGCSSTREVETSRPRAYEAEDGGEPESPRQARVSIFLERGETDLPHAIDHLRFRTAEIRLRTTEGEWIRLPSDASPVEIARGTAAQRRLVLDTRIAPMRYDSMAVTLNNVFVRFNENAGAPLTTASDAPQQFVLDLEARLDVPTTVHLRLEPQPSLRRTQDCRWFFVPMFRVDVSRDAPGSP